MLISITTLTRAFVLIAFNAIEIGGQQRPKLREEHRFLAAHPFNIKANISSFGERFAVKVLFGAFGFGKHGRGTCFGIFEGYGGVTFGVLRSEERRVGKECA